MTGNPYTSPSKPNTDAASSSVDARRQTLTHAAQTTWIATGLCLLVLTVAVSIHLDCSVARLLRSDDSYCMAFAASVPVAAFFAIETLAGWWFESARIAWAATIIPLTCFPGLLRVADVLHDFGEGEDWTAGSAGGKRALAILDLVQKNYRIDVDRVSLTGHSMGGAGTWSLAASDPKRWAAIVPVSHGGDATSAARLTDIPCWCFHGDADKMIRAQQSREMVQAIKEAGGWPLHQEFTGVGHNDGADHAYALPDLYEWLLLQSRAKR